MMKIILSFAFWSLFVQVELAKAQVKNPSAADEIGAACAHPLTQSVLYFAPGHLELAKKIRQANQKISLRLANFKKFPDGFPNLFIHDAESLRGKNVAFLADFNSPGAIFEQLAVIYALPSYSPSSFKLFLPYFPTGTMERIVKEGEVATAMTLARMLSSIPLTKSGPSEIYIYDIHALQERFYFRDRVMPNLCSAVELFKAQLKSKGYGPQNAVIAFPDDGAHKRFGAEFADYKKVVFGKQRDGNNRTLSYGEGKEFVQNAHVFIVDDLVHTGGTLLACKDLLKGKNAQGIVDQNLPQAASVSVFVTHGVFPNESWKKFSKDEFKHFWLTDSVPATVTAIAKNDLFEVLSLAGKIAASMSPLD